jgi:hypothetical protein
MRADNVEYCDNIGDATAPYILVGTQDLSDMAKNLQTETKTMIPQLSFTGYYWVTSFEHPTTGQMIIAAPDYKKRMSIATRLFRDTGYAGFQFVNQSYCKLARMSFQIEFGELPLESYGPEQLDILQRFPITPFTCETGNYCDENLISIDMAKCYTARLLNNVDDYPIFSFGDKKQPYVKSDDKLPVGEYYISCKIRMADGNLVFKHGWYPRVFQILP